MEKLRIRRNRGQGLGQLKAVLNKGLTGCVQLRLQKTRHGLLLTTRFTCTC